MIVINGIIETTAADIDRLRDAIHTMEQASRAEAGCHDYTFSVELGNANAIRITELWDDMDVLSAHFVTPHMAEFQKAMAGANIVSSKVKFFEATEVSPPGR